MYVKRYGTGGRIFFGLHGWSGDHTTFAPLEPYLPADASLLSVDLPACGQSPAPARWTLDCLASEIAAEVERAGSGGITLIGNCSGAILGLIAMPRIDGLVDRLVLIDPFAYTPWYFRIFISTSLGKYAYYTAFANPVGRLIANLSLQNHRTDRTDLTASFRGVDHESTLRYLKLLDGIGGIGGFSGVRQPIDIVYGEKTFGAVKKSLGMWKAIWPQAVGHELAGAGHLPIEEATEELSRIVFGNKTATGAGPEPA